MSSRNQYKALLTTTKQALRQMTISKDNLKEGLGEAILQIGLLKAELERVRTRKWYQFWKFLKRNQII